MYLKLIATTSTLGAAVVGYYYYRQLNDLHGKLSRQIQHTGSKGTLTAATTGNIASIPRADMAEEQCVMIHDNASKSIVTDLLPALEDKDLLTQYLRHTMVEFCRLPQAWIMRLMVSSRQRETFQPAYIRNLGFEKGDVVCGVYEVVDRSGGKVEFSMLMLEPVNGRMVVSVEKKKKDGETLFGSETIMWKRRGEKAVMPLERGVAKWMHEIAAWWLLDSGTRHLVELKERASGDDSNST